MTIRVRNADNLTSTRYPRDVASRVPPDHAADVALDEPAHQLAPAVAKQQRNVAAKKSSRLVSFLRA